MKRPTRHNTIAVTLAAVALACCAHAAALVYDHKPAIGLYEALALATPGIGVLGRSASFVRGSLDEVLMRLLHRPDTALGRTSR